MAKAVYATLEEMQQMEFGVTNDVRTINGVRFERLEKDGLYGWAALSDDEKGEMVSWDRVSESEAKELGLVAYGTW
jgi:hypothetical protein